MYIKAKNQRKESSLSHWAVQSSTPTLIHNADTSTMFDTKLILYLEAVFGDNC